MKTALLITSIAAFTFTVAVVWSVLPTALFGLLVTLIGLLTFDFYRLLPGDVNYGWKKGAILYGVSLFGRICGHVTNYRLQCATRHVKETQASTLGSILKRNADTEYGRFLKLSRTATREEFRKSVPLSKYPDVKPFVDRAISGETAIFTPGDLSLFATTSGTSTGTRSLLPISKLSIRALLFQATTVMLRHVPDEYFPDGRQLRNVLRFTFCDELKKTPGGVPIGPASTLTNSAITRQITPSPPVVFSIHERERFSYVNFLFALNDPSVGVIVANFAVFALAEFDFLMAVWKELVVDLETGRISAKWVPDEELRRELQKSLAPNPDRASEIRRHFLTGRQGLARRLWPHCSYVNCIASGSMALYASALQDSFCQGLPMYSGFYVSSEALVGVNLWPRSPVIRYLPFLTLYFMEFIPVENSTEENPETLFMDQLEIDKDYELVLTTIEGLYRYRNGDVIRVSRFHNECPLLEFRYRLGQLLNVAGEKTTEAAFYTALTLTLGSQDDITLVDYTTMTSISFEKYRQRKVAEELRGSGNYQIFLELKGKVTDTGALCEKMDQTLRQVAPMYDDYRQNHGLGQMDVQLVHPGTFQKFIDRRCQDLKSAVSQFKMPRYLTTDDHIKFFIDNIA